MEKNLLPMYRLCWIHIVYPFVLRESSICVINLVGFSVSLVLPLVFTLVFPLVFITFLVGIRSFRERSAI